MKTTYTVLPSDNFYTIAQKLYGSQRYAGLLLDANPGISALHPGMELDVPEPPDDGQTVYFSPSAHKRSQDIDKLFAEFDSDPDFPDDPLLNTPAGLALDPLFDDFPPFSDDMLNEVFDEQDHIDNLLRKIGWEEMLEIDFVIESPRPYIP